MITAEEVKKEEMTVKAMENTEDSSRGDLPQALLVIGVILVASLGGAATLLFLGGL